jgi:hypothetical protein
VGTPPAGHPSRGGWPERSGAGRSDGAIHPKGDEWPPSDCPCGTHGRFFVSGTPWAGASGQSPRVSASAMAPSARRCCAMLRLVVPGFTGSGRPRRMQEPFATQAPAFFGVGGRQGRAVGISAASSVTRVRQVDKSYTFPLCNRLKWRSDRQLMSRGSRVPTMPDGPRTRPPDPRRPGEDTQIPRDYRANGGGM